MLCTLPHIPFFRMSLDATKPFLQKNCRTFSSTIVSQRAPNISTVDAREIRHHEKLKQDWWFPNGPMKALHTYNELRVPFIRDGLMGTAGAYHTCLEPLAKAKILDVGCGGGILSMPLSRLGAKVIGIDASNDLINVAKAVSVNDIKRPDRKPEFYCETVEEHARTNQGVYDGVVASEVIEHVQHKELFVRKLVECTKPGGKIFITTPNRTKWAEFGVIWFSENVMKTVPKGTHHIEKFITPQELTFLFERHGACVEMIHGVLYNAFTNRWSWATYNVFAYAMRAVRTAR